MEDIGRGGLKGRSQTSSRDVRFRLGDGSRCWGDTGCSVKVQKKKKVAPLFSVFLKPAPLPPPPALTLHITLLSLYHKKSQGFLPLSCSDSRTGSLHLLNWWRLPALKKKEKKETTISFPRITMFFFFSAHTLVLFLCASAAVRAVGRESKCSRRKGITTAAASAQQRRSVTAGWFGSYCCFSNAFETSGIKKKTCWDSWIPVSLSCVRFSHKLVLIPASLCVLFFFQDPLLDLEQQMGTPVGGGRGSGGKVLQRPSAAVKMDAGTAGAEAAILVSVREQRGTVRRFSSSRYVHLNVYLKLHC